MSSKTVTIGADPEFFITDSKGTPVPICGLLGGTKKNPLRMSPQLSSGYTMQEDNVMVEFNIPPVSRLSSFIDAIQTATSTLTAKLNAMGYYVSRAAEVQFDVKTLDKLPQAQTFGCSPDYNAYEQGDEWPRIDPKSLNSWRFAGGHVHVGYTGNLPNFVAASFADLFIGLRVCTYDTQKRRKEVYGKPGRYRPTAYGIEYRTPSNHWIWEYGSIMEMAQAALSFGEYMSISSRDLQKAYSTIPWQSVQEAISNSDSNLGLQVRQFVNTELKWEL